LHYASKDLSDFKLKPAWDVGDIMESNAGAGQLLSNALKLAGPLSWKGMKGW